MSLKKGVCPECENKHHRHRIFDVNSDAHVCFCPTCLSNLSPQTAIETYEHMMTSLTNEGDSSLFDYQDPVKAYQQYSFAVEVDNGWHNAYLGRMLALVAMSTLKNSKIQHVTALLVKDQDFITDCCKKEHRDDFLLFGLRLYYYVAFFYKKMGDKLKNNELFYDLPSLICFINRSLEIVSLLEVVKTIIGEIGERSSVNELKETYKKINALHRQINSEISVDSRYSLIDGGYYTFIGLNEKHKPILKKSNYTNRERASQNDEEENKHHYNRMNEQVFPNQSFRVKFSIRAYFFMAGFFLLGLAFVVTFLYFKEGGLYFILLGLGGFFFLLSIFSFLIRISTLKMIRKRRKTMYYHKKFIVQKE